MDSTLSALTASTPGTAGLLYAVQGGADRKLSMTAAGATLLEAANAAAQLTALGAATLGANTFTGAQTITQASANAGILASTGYSLTGSNATSMIDLAGTWNTTGTPSAIKLRITDTASNAASKLIDLGIGANSYFGVSKTSGNVYVGDQSSIFNGVNIYAPDNTTYIRMGYSSIVGVSLGTAVWNTTDTSFQIQNGCWLAFNGSLYGATDLILRRDAAGTLAQRNSTNAQTTRIYGTYTDASNYTRLSLAATSTTMTIACETLGTGADDIDLTLTPAGTGCVKFGTHAAIGAETVTGYITIKDSGGTARKLAVVS